MNSALKLTSQISELPQARERRELFKCRKTP